MGIMRNPKPLSCALVLLLSAAALSSCGGRRPPSGAAAPPPGKTTAPEPKLRPTQRPYTVMGRTYEPLRTHAGYAQDGVASWYGTDFHGKKTSNGEVYDMHAMTAAHKTLPMNVYVKVRNRENGREIVVRINDRGPFVKDRVIDLSYAAAKALGVDQKGTAPVHVAALGYRSQASSGEFQYQEPESYDAGNFAVQIGSFKDPQNAQRLAQDMRNLHGHAEIQAATVNGERFSRVLVGKYASLKAAEEAERKFSSHGYRGSFIVALD